TASSNATLLSSSSLLAFFLSATSVAVSISPPSTPGELSFRFAPDPARGLPFSPALAFVEGDFSLPIRDASEAICVEICEAARSLPRRGCVCYGRLHPAEGPRGMDRFGPAIGLRR